MPKAKKASFRNSVKIIPAKSGHGWTMIANGEKRASNRRAFTYNSKQEAIKAAVTTFYDKGENVRVTLQERDGTTHDFTSFAEREIARASSKRTVSRKVLFPAVPSATGNEAIRRAVEDAMRQLGE